MRYLTLPLRFFYLFFCFFIFANQAYAQCPAATSFLPVSGPANTLVTITGSGFTAGTGTTSVKFNGIETAGLTIVSDTSLKAIVPAGASNGAISITANGCTVNAPVFTVIVSNCTQANTATEIYISELYDQRTGSGGMIELYNPTNNVISLTGYVLQRYGDIDDDTPTVGYVLPLTGSISPESTYLIACSSPNTSFCAAPTENIALGAGFNGNDKFELLKNNSVIDRILVPFTGPGFTLIRNTDAVAPSTTYNANDWDNFQHDNSITNTFCADLGNHSTVPFMPPAIVLQPESKTVCQDINTQFTVAIDMPAGFTYQWRMLTPAGAWVNVPNNTIYSGANTAQLNINTPLLTVASTQFYCVMTAGTCVLVSNTAQLTVSPLPVVIVNRVHPTCHVATGSFTITAQIGDNLTYSFDNGPFQAGTSFNNIAPGTKNLVIKSADGCQTTVPVTINAVPGTPVTPIAVATHATCTDSLGDITITNPQAGIEYSIGGAFQTGAVFNNVPAATYTVTARNAGGCTSAISVTVNPSAASPVTPTAVATHATCTDPLGDITITNPQTGVEYSIGGAFQAGAVFNNVPAATYTVTARNAGGCTSATSVTVNPAATSPVTPIAVATHATCTDPLGDITITNPQTGVEYSIGGAFQTGAVFNNVPAATYTVTARNAGGCTSTTSVTVNPSAASPVTPTAVATHATCTNPLGDITITNPQAGVEYSIGGAFQTGAVFNNVPPATYTVTARNAGGCTSTVIVAVNPAVGVPATPVATAVRPGCGQIFGTITIANPETGVQYSIGGAFQTAVFFTNVAPGPYTVTAKNVAGCTSSVNVTVNPAPELPASPIVMATHPACGQSTGSITINNPVTGVEYSIGGAFQSATAFNNVPSGPYTVTARNVDGCTSSSNISINPAPVVPVTPVATIAQPTCTQSTGTITISNPEAGVQYSIGGAFQTVAVFNNVAPGAYTVTARNAGGCTSSTNVTVNTSGTGTPEITATQECTETTFGNNYILEALPLNNSFDVATASFKWENEQGVTLTGYTDNTFNVSRYVTENVQNPQFPMTFTVTVTTPGGCFEEHTFIVERAFCDVPRGISPNNDGRNDSFNLSGFNVTKLMIYNRYGKEVYNRNNYTNEWLGQDDNSNELPTGTYFYVIESGKQPATGWVYINREN